jgi:hypothetical protein
VANENNYGKQHNMEEDLEGDTNKHGREYFERKRNRIS